MEKIIKLGEKEYTIKEIKYKELVTIGNIPQEEASKKLMEISAGIDSEAYEELSLKDGVAIQKVINDINGLGEDFQKPLVD